MPDEPKERGRPEPLWRAVMASCVVEAYDFQYYKKSNPPLWNEESLLLEFVIKKPRL